MSPPQVIVVGGGAAGFFAAITCAEANPSCQVDLFEATSQLLAKVKISGGGRCNVTHACFDPAELVQRYPRGKRELLGPFHRWQPGDTVRWFAQRGVALKTEEDGRMFPVTDSSQTIIDCLRAAASKAKVHVRTRCGVTSAVRTPGGFQVALTTGEFVRCDRLLLATGGGRSSAGFRVAADLGHTIEPLVPSLFTFNVDDGRLRDLAGVAVAEASVAVEGTRLAERGPVLITHWGLSGPAILRLSAWGARELATCSYRFRLRVNWAGTRSLAALAAELKSLRGGSARRHLSGTPGFGLPQRLWERLVAGAGIAPEATWSSISNDALGRLAEQVGACQIDVTGKSTNKDEFVTCGGVRLSEVDFRTMESRVCPRLHFAGEVLDIDGVTGGFNFQAAWTTGRLAGAAMADFSL